MPAFRRPPDPPDPALFDALVRSHRGFCERWAARMERAHPGRDFGPRANMALWKAASAHAAGSRWAFATLLKWQLRDAYSAEVRRRPRLTMSPLDLEGVAAEEGPEEPEGQPPDLGRLLAGLPPRDRLVIRLRYSERMTLPAIAGALGVTAQCVHKIERRALVAMRRAAG